MNNEELKNVIINLLSPYADEMEDARLGEFLALSVGRVLMKGSVSDINEDIHEILDHIKDWLKAAIINNDSWINNLDADQRPKKLMKFNSIDQIYKEADRAMLKYAQRVSGVKLDEGDEELVSELEDGYYIVRLLTPKALDKESGHMQHCIGQGAYDFYLKETEHVFLSLRSPTGKPHVTLEVKGNQIKQLQGKQNKLPMQKYIDILKPFLQEKKYSINQLYPTIGFISDIKGSWHDVNNLPDNMIIPDDLIISQLRIKQLPKNLTVLGNLNIEKTGINKLPEGLKISEGLYAALTSLTELPYDIEVGGLDITRTNIKKLPSHIEKYSFLNIANTYISELPKALKHISGNCDLRKTKISKLPNDFYVGGELDVSLTNIKKLPDVVQYSALKLYNTKIETLPYMKDYTLEHLWINSSKIKELPDNLTVNGVLVLSNEITALPDNLTVNYKVDFSDTKIETIPDNIKIKYDINLANTNIRFFPNIDTVNGCLNLKDTKKLQYLPYNLTVFGSLNLSGSNLPDLPLNLRVVDNLTIHNTKFEKLPPCLFVGMLDIRGSKITEIPEGLKVHFIIIMNEDQITDFPASIGDDVEVYVGSNDDSVINMKPIKVSDLRSTYSNRI